MEILVVVDVQNDFVTGSLGSEEAKSKIPNIVNLIKSKDWDLVLATRDTHQENYLSKREGRVLPIKHCIENTDGWNICPEVAAELSKIPSNKLEYVDKTTFGRIALPLDILKHTGLTAKTVNVTFCGFCTDICVISNVMLVRAGMPEAEIYVVEDCCAGVTPQSHQAALDVMTSCQINIV